MAIPFFAMIDFISQNGDFQEIKLNKKYRIERTQQQPLSMIRVYFYKNHFGILEKNICRPDYSEIVEEVMNLKNNENISSFDMKSIPIQNAKLVSENIDSIGIEYRIANKKKVVYHRLYNEDGY